MSQKKLTLIILGGTVFLGSVLLFMLEPLVGRMLLPYLGGSIHVWLTCLMFYQAMLLLGYLYAHFMVNKNGLWHLLFLMLPLINLPLNIITEPVPQSSLITVLTVLFIHVSLPFIMLSTTSIVAQTWLAQSKTGRYYDPYYLYGISNFGSLVGLFGYVFVVEPLAGVRLQSFGWFVIYIVYILFAGITWYLLKPDAKLEDSSLARDSEAKIKERPASKKYFQWLLLSSVPSAFLLAVTNFVALEIGSFPLVWVVPLALYLGSFILTFRQNGGVPKFLTILWPETILLGLLLYQLGSIWWHFICGHLLVLFTVSLIAHGTLYKIRPVPANLTKFYITIALGGFLGGAFINIAAPFLFTGLFEYPLILIVFGGIFSFYYYQTFSSFLPRASLLVSGVRLLIIGLMLAITGIGFFTQVKKPVKFRHRNFYGIYTIRDNPANDKLPCGVRKLIHGSTLHGAQLLDPALRLMPITYYYKGGGISDVYETVPSPRRIAVVGLGAGGTAAYTVKNDSITFYEIDPDNEAIARRWFTYLKDCKGSVDVVIGDGRLSLQQAELANKEYSLIHVDAFSGDGIPTHLMTKEAVEIYLNRLSKNGIILFHISNRYYDLRSVVKSTVGLLGLHSVMNIMPDKNKLKVYEMPSQVIAVSRDAVALTPLIESGWVKLNESDGLNKVEPWTDDYINILAPIFSRVRSEK